MVVVARDPLAVLSAWTLVALVLVLLAVLAVGLRLLVQLRRHTAAWEDFLTTTRARSAALVDHAGNAARNLDRMTHTVRTEVERLGGSVGGVAGTLEEAANEIRRRARDLLALLDLAQSEAEGAVLETASRLRALREGAAGLFLAQRARGGGREEDQRAAEMDAGVGEEAGAASGEPSDGDGDEDEERS